MTNYSEFKRISNEMCKTILNYYRQLYVKYEMDTTPNVAKQLDISEDVVRRFHERYIAPDEESFSDIEMIIMLTNKFAPNSNYYEKQQRVYGELIKQRQEIKNQKDKHDEIAKMVKKRSMEYMKKRKSC